MTVWDCFPFSTEVDLLEIRLNMLKDVVDRFVIVESNYTHSGKPKPYFIDEDMVSKRFAEFPIDYYVLDLGPLKHCQNSWIRENWHRECIYECIKGEIVPDDVVILSDVDEIPRPKLIEQRILGRYIQDMYYFYLNGYADQTWPSGTIVMSGMDASQRTFQFMRLDKKIPEVETGGWHFSSVGTLDQIVNKMKSFAHTEYDNKEAIDKVIEHYHNFKSIYGDSLQVEELELLPKYVRDNLDKYRHLIYDPMCTV